MVEVDGKIPDLGMWLPDNIELLASMPRNHETFVTSVNRDLLVIRTDEPNEPFGVNRAGKLSGRTSKPPLSFIYTQQIHNFPITDEGYVSIYSEAGAQFYQRAANHLGGVALQYVPCQQGGKISNTHYQDHLDELSFPMATWDLGMFMHDRAISDHAGAFLFSSPDVLEAILDYRSVVDDPDIYVPFFDDITGWIGNYAHWLRSVEDARKKSAGVKTAKDDLRRSGRGLKRVAQEIPGLDENSILEDIQKRYTQVMEQYDDLAKLF